MALEENSATLKLTYLPKNCLKLRLFYVGTNRFLEISRDNTRAAL